MQNVKAEISWNTVIRHGLKLRITLIRNLILIGYFLQ